MINGFGMQLLFSPQNSNLETLDKTLTPEYRKLANIILRRIRDQKVGSHYELIIGPRGSGKTHILSFIYKTIKKEFADGEKLKVIRLSEEERGLTSLLDFLLACLRACNLSPEEIAGNVMRGDAVTALSAAEDLFRNQTGNIPMQIFMENLSDIFRGFKNNDLLDLRGFFQTHPNISLIASSVILYKSSSRPDHPFYGFFNIHPLESLDRKNARIFLATLAEANKKNELAKELRKEQAQAKVNAIYDLTGGNHRLLSMLANVLDVAGLAELVGPFVQMVDRELTPYYQQRLSSLSPQQNKILRAIADHHGKALAVKEIAYFTFLASQVVSRQLHDLYHGLFIKRNKIGRESFYELNEPLLRIVLDMKEGRDGPLPLIVNFLRFWYAEKELRKLEKEAPADIQTYYHEALREMQKIEREVTFKEQISVSDEITIEVSRAKVGERAMDDQLKETQTLLDEAYSFHEQEQYLEAITILDKLIKRFVESDQPEILEQFSRALVYKGVTLGKLDRSEDSIAVYDEVIERFGKSDQPELLEGVARALVNKGVTLGQLDRSEDEIAVYDELIERFGKSDKPELLERVARALVNKGVMLGQLDRSEDAIAVYDEVIERFGESDRPELLERVARALVNKGVMLGQLDRSEDAIAVYDEVIERFGESDQPELLEGVAGALVNKGVMLGQLDRSEDSIAVYDEVIERFVESDRPELLEQVAGALFNKGVTLGQLDRFEDEIAVYDEVIERFVESDQTELLEQVAGALVNKGVTLGKLDRFEDAIAVYNEVIERFGESDQPELLEQVAGALVNKGVTLGQLDRFEDEIAVYNEVIERFGKSDKPELLERVTKALVNKGVTLGQLDRSEDEIAVYDELIERFGKSDKPELLERVARALFNKGVTLGRLDRSEDAIAVYDEVIERFGESDQPELLERVARALVNKGVTLGKLDRSEDEIAVYDEVIERFGKSDQPELLERVAKALVNKGVTLGQLDRSADEIAVYDEVIERFGESDQPELLERVAKALVNKGVTLGQLDRSADEIAVYDEVIERFGESDQPELLEGVSSAHIGSAIIRSALNNYSEALADFEKALRIKPDQSRAHAGYIEMLFALGQVDNALVALNEAFDIFTDSPSDLSYIFSRLINRFNKSENILKRVVDLFVNKEQKSSLVEGTLVWLKGLLPMSEEEARDLEGAEKVLTNVFANVPETQTVLEVFVAVRQDAMGDPKALMSIPLELRRLIEEEKSN